MVIAFAVVQSVFGVGLLVFGTPTLLLVGFSFAETLAYLLPCSIVISLLQVVAGGGFGLDDMRRRFLIYTAPLVLVGATLILTVGSGVDIRLLVGAMLLVSGAIRLLGPVRARVDSFVRRQLNGFLVLLGAIHGLSNLGGGVLTLIVGSVYETKEDIRRQIAFCYGMMAVIQLATLFFTTSPDIDPVMLVLLPVIAAFIFQILGNRAFRAATQVVYQFSLTALIVVFGMILMVGI
ncbi:MAG TPA: hypothetical protein VEB69_03035 [Acidimicrobiia bacterium]|nr:hypothetical protein [Acidimicrobiia bacterium]